MKLVSALAKAVHERVTVELKNGDVVTGTLAHVDARMNVRLRSARLVPRGRPGEDVDALRVRGSAIRYVIFPDNLPLDPLLLPDAKPLKAAKPKDRKRGLRHRPPPGAPSKVAKQ